MNNLATPARSQVKKSDKWDIEKLYADDAAWNSDLEKLPKLLDSVLKLKPLLEDSEKATAQGLLSVLKAVEALEKVWEKTGHYASLMKAADGSDTANNERMGKFSIMSVDLSAKLSWLTPMLLKLPEDKLRQWIAQPEFVDYKVYLEKELRAKDYVLSEREEAILSQLGEALDTPSEAFSVLENVSFDFGTIETKEGNKPLTNSSYSQFLLSEDRALREKAYKQYYGLFNQYKDTIAAMYAGAVKTNVAYAKIRGFKSARHSKLYWDKVDESVYDNLIDTVHKNFKPLHKYYSIVKKTLKVDELRHYDVYVPLVPAVNKVTPYEDAVAEIYEAVRPLGEEYAHTLKNGLLNGWVDRYENIGKRSGAFSSGGWEGLPYILLSYKPDVIRDMFTLVHEGGHSMHSWYSTKNNPFMSYSYSIFEAEVASTFNEELLFQHLLKKATDKTLKTYLLSTRVSDILSTLYRQTMFAEYEKISHAALEAGTPITTDFLRTEYGKLLKEYFGSAMVFEPESNLECLRIPHFYRAFYVYKYSTGISASLALSHRVLTGGNAEREDYFNFLKSGGSRYPLEALKVAGVDMSTPAPVQAACDHFAKLVDELEAALKDLGKL